MFESGLCRPSALGHRSNSAPAEITISSGLRRTQNKGDSQCHIQNSRFRLVFLSFTPINIFRAGGLDYVRLLTLPTRATQHNMPGVSCQERNPYCVRIVTFASGERVPLLIAGATGEPLFQPNLYATTHLRARGRATETIHQALRSIMVLQLTLDRLGINLDGRMDEGRLLDRGDIDEIARACNVPLETLVRDVADAPGASLPLSRLKNLERVRMVTKPAPAQIDPSTAAIRLHYIRDYLKWRTSSRLFGMGPKDGAYAALKVSADLVRGVLAELAPVASNRHGVTDRKGFLQTEIDTILAVMDPASPTNPWKGEHTTARNFLIAKWLITLGIRRGELLNVRIDDIDFQTERVRIERRPDDERDPRPNQPRVKTRGRDLPLGSKLAALTHAYVRTLRAAQGNARKHGYLFVANGTGAPLSLPQVAAIFTHLRRSRPELPRNLMPHVLGRHSWNTRFSELADERKLSAEVEKKVRSRAMGWSETSNTAVTYTRRHVEREADELIRALYDR
jgi:integrase